MKRYKISHQTSYSFFGTVELYPHTLRLRPREGHELRIENSILDISPSAVLRWHRDVEENSVATATFSQNTNSLHVSSEIIIQQYNQAPYDFLVAEYAIDYPFSYSDEEKVMLAAYMDPYPGSAGPQVTEWVNTQWQQNETIQTFTLLLNLNTKIYQSLTYRIREEEGVQSAEETLSLCSGSCRDAANLFMTAARHLGFASRFVSGYQYVAPVPGQTVLNGATHAWAEVFIPGAGWKGFDPTMNSVVGPDHIAVAVARLPELVPPISGAFHGPPGANMYVQVQVTELRTSD